MQANEVLGLLQVSRQTLSKYVKSGDIKVRVLESGRYVYDDESVYKFMRDRVNESKENKKFHKGKKIVKRLNRKNRDKEIKVIEKGDREEVRREEVKKDKKTCIYARVAHNDKEALDNQIEMLRQFCFANGYKISDIFSDVASDIQCEERKGFMNMLDSIMNGEIERVVVVYKDRLSRSSFELFSRIFKKFDCEIVVMSEVGSKKLDNVEIFQDMASLLGSYNMQFMPN